MKHAESVGPLFADIIQVTNLFVDQEERDSERRGVVHSHEAPTHVRSWCGIDGTACAAQNTHSHTHVDAGMAHVSRRCHEKWHDYLSSKQYVWPKSFTGLRCNVIMIKAIAPFSIKMHLWTTIIFWSEFTHHEADLINQSNE